MVRLQGRLGHAKEQPMRDREFLEKLEEHAAAVQAVLAVLLSGEARQDETVRPERLLAAMRHGVLNGGKRMRPALVIESAALFAGDPEAALRVAAALECVHCYSLIHDDLPAMDDDDERRGRPTVHVAFGEAIAILAGDGLLTQAFATLAELGPNAAAAVAVLAQRSGSRELLAGQAIDLTATRSELSTLAAVERLHAAKTGALFAAAAELGAISAGADAATCAALGRYGLAIGIAFQHADDRDDHEFSELADQAAERMRVLGAEARAIAASLGARGDRLGAIAGWFAAQA